MELVERFQSFRRNVHLADDSGLPWYRQRKYIMFLIIGVLVLAGVAVLFFGGYFAGLAANKEDENSIPEPESRIILPPLEWEGFCPKRNEKCPTSYEGIPALILVSLDGFHPDFMNRGFTPTIKNISRCGVHAPYMFPVFPTKTFPNHYSQVTGLYPPYHGIVDNNMYDPFKRKLFKVGQPEMLEPSWWLKEPIWVTAQRQGKISGCYYWPGSEVAINGSHPTYYKKYNSKAPFESRVDQVLAWLDLPKSSRPHFLTLYVNEPDHVLHAYGTKSRQLNESLGKVNRLIERLFAGLQQRNLLNCVNVVIMSDHGMTDTDCKRVHQIQNYIQVNDSFITAGPFARIRPKGRRNATIVNEFVSKLSCKSPHMRVYPKEQLPVRMHYVENPRIEPIFVDIDAGWTAVSKSPGPEDHICTGGAHGYDNMFKEMRAIFLAYGPSFKKNVTMQPFLNIEVYEMIAELIGVTPNPNNGTKGSMHYIMSNPKTLTPPIEPDPPGVPEVPTDPEVYEERLSASTCTCKQSSKQQPVENIAATKNLHMPFGIPYDDEERSSSVLLYNENHVDAFSLKYRMPIWSSFTLQQKEYNEKVNICFTGDVRISSNDSPKCSDFIEHSNRANKPLIQQPLFSPGFLDSSASEQAVFITNAVAKSSVHANVIQKNFDQMLSKWVSETGKLNVVTGPAFDINASGVKPNSDEFMRYYEKLGPVLVPTHIFVVATWCSTKADSLPDTFQCHPSKLQSQGYLLPNEPYPNNCGTAAADVISKNVARVADIEKLTGITFYSKLPVYEAIRLRTMMPERSF